VPVKRNGYSPDRGITSQSNQRRPAFQAARLGTATFVYGRGGTLHRACSSNSPRNRRARSWQKRALHARGHDQHPIDHGVGIVIPRQGPHVKDLGRVWLRTGNDGRRVNRFGELHVAVERSETGSFGRRSRNGRRSRGCGDVPPGDGGGDDEREKDETQQPDADQSAIGT